VSRRRRALVLAGLALVLGALSASEVASREAEIEQRIGGSVGVVVAVKAINRGRRIDASVLGLRDVPAKFAPAQSFATAGQLIGARAAVAIRAGTDLQPSLLEGSQAGPDGALSLAGADERIVRVIAVGDAAEVTPGSRVDLLITRDGASGRTSTVVGLRDAEVIGSGPAAAVADGAGAGLPRVAMALRVSLNQAVLLAEAQNSARELRALPRPPSAAR